MTAWMALAGWVVAGTAMGSTPPPRPAEGAIVPRAAGQAPHAEPEATKSPSELAPAPAPAPAAVAGPPAASPGGVTQAPPASEGGVAEGVADGAPSPDAGANEPGATLQGDAAEPFADEAPAPLPPQGPPPPKPSEPRAWGGAFDAPLPPAPAAADPSTLRSTPWRGRVWLGVGLAASFPLGGRPPAAGGVIGLAAEADLGFRLNRFLALHTSVSSFAHDAARRTVAVPDGTVVPEVEIGRITAFDLVTARVFVPVHRRIEPWAEVGLGVGSRRGPFALERQAVGLVRVGAGVDFWLAPTLTLGASAVYRTIILGDAVGHALRAGADFGIHW